MEAKLEWLEDGRLYFGDGNESEVIAVVSDALAEIYGLPEDAAGFAAARAVSLLRIGETEIDDAEVDEEKERIFCEFLVNNGAKDDMAHVAARATARYVADDFPRWGNMEDAS